MTIKVNGKPFRLYGNNGDESAEVIAEISTATNELWARRENSGCESCYVEVARWSTERERWERFAFAKMLNVVFYDDSGEVLEFEDEEKADRLVNMINTETDFAFIHNLPDWEGERKPAPCEKNYS